MPNGFCSAALYHGMANNPDKPRSFRQCIRHLHPYYCLLLLVIPAAIIEPLKMAGLVVVGSGHWLGGVAILACAYVLSFSLLTRLFKIVQPRLLILPWFRAGRARLLRFRRKIYWIALWRNIERGADIRATQGRTNDTIMAPLPKQALRARD
jgi:hypothetical protein